MIPILITALDPFIRSGSAGTGPLFKAPWRRRITMALAAVVILAGCAAPSSSVSSREVGALVDPAALRKPARSASAISETKAAYDLLHVFKLEPDGVDPTGLFVDGSGTIYGTTYGGGGATSYGTVFKLEPTGKAYAFKSIYDFYGSNGENPNPPVEDSDGNLYLTTLRGGAYSAGAAVKLSPSAKGYVQTAFYSFGSAGDGATPGAQFTLVGDTLYTTTAYGGKYGQGTLVAMSTKDLSEKGRYSFTSEIGELASTTLASGSNGNLYGTASGGPGGEGFVYEFPPDGKAPRPSIVYAFNLGSAAFSPVGDVAVDSYGNVYGTAFEGGASDCGAVFALSYASGSYTLSLLHSFAGGNDGCFPQTNGIVLDGGLLAGATESGGADGNGTIFALSTTGSNYAVVHVMKRTTGSWLTDLVPSGASIYGTTQYGGPDSAGVVFRLTSR